MALPSGGLPSPPRVVANIPCDGHACLVLLTILALDRDGHRLIRGHF